MIHVPHSKGIILTPAEWARVTVFIVGTRMVARIFSIYSLLIGVSIILGGVDRFSAPGYATALRIPGAPVIWGAIICIAGLISTFGVAIRNDNIVAFGLLIASAWSFMFAVTFAWSAVQDPSANLTAMWVYGKDGFLFAAAAAVLHSYGRVRVNEAPPEG